MLNFNFVSCVLTFCAFLLLCIGPGIEIVFTLLYHSQCFPSLLLEADHEYLTSLMLSVIVKRTQCLSIIKPAHLDLSFLC